MANRLDYMEAKDTINQSLLKIKSAQVDNLRIIIGIREDHLIAANAKIMAIEAEKIKQKRLIIAYQIGLIAATTLLLVSLF